MTENPTKFTVFQKTGPMHFFILAFQHSRPCLNRTLL